MTNSVENLKRVVKCNKKKTACLTLSAMILTLILSITFIGLEITIEKPGNEIDVYGATTPTINATSTEIFALGSSAKEKISIPSNLKQSFQIVVKNASSVKYSIYSSDSSYGNTVTVSSTGLVEPRITTYYKYSGYSSTYKDESQEILGTYTSVNPGTTTIKVVADSTTFYVKVKVNDYATYYADQVMQDYIDTNITSSMTGYEKLEKIAQFIASYDYNASYCGYVSMIVYGGGDCWASTSATLKMCELLGIEAWIRNGNRDIGSGSGHRNAMAYVDGKYYEIEAGYTGTAPRYYYVKERTSLFDGYYSSSLGGVYIYQYSGNNNTGVLTVPDTYNGYPVVKIADKAFSGTGFSEIVIPDSVTSIGDYSFSGCTSLEKLNIPAKVSSIGKGTFAQCNKLSRLTMDSANESFALKDGIIYTKDMTELVSAPYVSSAVIPNTVTTIRDYSLYYNFNLASVVIPASVTSIGEGAFGDTRNLTDVTFKGKCPTMSNYVFYDVKATVKIPAGKWTDDEKQNYNGTLTWQETNMGWIQSDGKWYYYDDEGVVTKGWTKLSNKWYYFNSDGIMTTGWCKINSKWYYFATNGIMTTGWCKINSKWYYFNSNGVMTTGWCKINSNWYYFNSNGIMTTGWCEINSNWYYFATNGVMTTGWCEINSNWYYFNTSGIMTTGWNKISNKWYYFNNSGIMQKNKWIGKYYVKSNGQMAISEWVDNGKYYVGTDGIWIQNS